MKIYMLFLTAMVIATNAFAQPQEIEVIGIIPGVSTESQVEAAKTVVRGDVRYHIIGGFGLSCYSEYIDNHLSSFTCYTGKNWDSTDETQEAYTPASNMKIHAVLVKGFTKKFGSPTSREQAEVRNGIGTRFNQEAIEWRDKKGNSLVLINILDKVTRGVLIMRSSQQFKLEKEQQEAQKKQRAF